MLIAYFKILFLNLPGVTEENVENLAHNSWPKHEAEVLPTAVWYCFFSCHSRHFRVGDWMCKRPL
jgi:hypothetical protein